MILIGMKDILAIITAWWITFTVVMILVFCVGFGSVGIAAGLANPPVKISAEQPPKLICFNRLRSRCFSVLDVWWLYSCRWSLRHFDKHGDGRLVDTLVGDTRFYCGYYSCRDSVETRNGVA